MKRGRILKKSLLILMAMIICFACVAHCFTVGAVASQTKVNKKETSYDIAVVFDNSGSMFGDGEANRWSYAKYSMGIFASMLNYERDHLTIFPMWEVTTDAGKSSLVEKIDISSGSDIQKISYIFTPSPGHTPMIACESAYNYLKASDKDEKWLVILTDGQFTPDESNKPLSEDVAKKRIKGFATDGIKIQYLGFGEATGYRGMADNKTIFSSTADRIEDLEAALIEVCNSIFQRNELGSFDPGSGKVNLKVSSSSILVFTQGESKNVTLKDAKGNEIQAALNNTVIADKDEKYSVGESGHFDDGDSYIQIIKRNIDKLPKLTGNVVSFNDCPAGQYTLSGVSKNSKVYYEPDVYIDVKLIKDGKEVTQEEIKNGLNPGEYEIKYVLMDGQTGKPVPEDANLDEKLKTYVDGKEYNNGDKIKLDADKNVDIEVKGTYLGGKYEISSDDNKDLHLRGIKILAETECYKINIDTSHLYSLMERDKWEPIVIGVTRGGKTVSEEELKAMKITIEDKIPFKTKINAKESAIEVELGKDENGNNMNPSAGTYEITASIEHKDEHGRMMKGSESKHFGISVLPGWLVFLIVLVIIILIIALIVFILNLPAWPRHMRFTVEKPREDEGLKITVKVRDSGMRIVPYENAIQCSAEKNSKIYHKLFKPKSMSIKVKNFQSDSVVKFSVGNHTYSAGKEFKLPEVENEIIVSGTGFEYVFDNGVKGNGYIEIY